jgi:acetylornithine deacetylase/succinyl-diaminopimelate desuccinylase-like protein
MAHSDTVSVEPEKWTHPPFGGDLVDGHVWGRGAVDTKNLVAVELMVMLLVKRAGLRLGRDLIMATFCDEEAGSRLGAYWMWENHRELIDAEAAINEGGGQVMELAGMRFYLVQTGEKGASRMRLTAHGEPGHASAPIPDTAMSRAGQALTALTNYTFPTVATKTVTRMLNDMADVLDGRAAEIVRQAAERPDPKVIAQLPLSEAEKRLLLAITRNTAVPTIVHGGHRINVIPGEVVIDVDGRLLPGQQPEEFAERVRWMVGPHVDVELTSRGSGLEADPESDFFDTIKSIVAELDPGSAAVPFLVSGGTDARALPGIKVYGFMPLPAHPEQSGLAHAHDERVSVANLEFAVRALYEIVTRYCAAGA